jgi:hypothetical protein
MKRARPYRKPSAEVEDEEGDVADAAVPSAEELRCVAA